MLSIIIMIVGGVFASISVITKLLPKTKKTFDKIIPIQGYVGLILLAWSVKLLLQFISYNAFDVITIVMLFTQFLVGFLLSFNLLSKYIFKSKKSKVKGQKINEVLINIQIPLGVLLTVFGVWNLIQVINL